jgi:Ran GTPase-activating protein (RanGAP) involved in mRNA processing and transport
MLQRNKTLRKLNLIGDKISDSGIIYIAKGLEKNTALRCLKMTGISAVGGKVLASAIATNASLPLVELALYDGHDLITEDSRQAFIDMLRQNTSIETLYLSFVGMPGSVSDPVPFLAEALQNNSTLKQLYLYDYISTPDMVKDVSRMLAVNRSLTSLDISGNSIGDDGVTHLAEALKQNKTLEKINISYCDITDVGVTHLAEALKQNKSLKWLDISNCHITDAGVSLLAEALQVNNSLRWLTVWGNNLTENGLTKLRELAAKDSNFHFSS